MKTIITFLILSLKSLVPFTSVEAQVANKKSLPVVDKESEVMITSVKANYASGRNYIKWTVKKLRYDDVFFVERSTDGINYKVIGLVYATGVPIDDDILYCFNETAPFSATVYYRISIDSKNTKISSQIVRMSKTISKKEKDLRHTAESKSTASLKSLFAHPSL